MPHPSPCEGHKQSSEDSRARSRIEPGEDILYETAPPGSRATEANSKAKSERYGSVAFIMVPQTPEDLQVGHLAF